jgi:hypothetical protein
VQRISRTGTLPALVLPTSTTSRPSTQAGHQAGDERLQALADAIRATQRAGDCAYRVGDEFAITPRHLRLRRVEFAQRLRAATQSGDHGVCSPSPRASPRAEPAPG